MLLTPVANLPPVSTIPAASSSLSGVCSLMLFQLFATGVNDAGGKLPPVSTTPAANLLPASLTPVANLELRISPRIFEKIRNGLNGVLWGWGESDS